MSETLDRDIKNNENIKDTNNVDRIKEQITKNILDKSITQVKNNEVAQNCIYEAIEETVTYVVINDLLKEEEKRNGFERSKSCNESSDERRINIKNHKNDIARRRWKLLAKALRKSRLSILDKGINKLLNIPSQDDISVRRITSFGLITPKKLENKLDSLEEIWMKYSTKISNEKYEIDVSHLNKIFTAEELMGFNNTGNICIWPSEEILTYYLLNNLKQFQNKSILELGGGMACLAGIMLAKYANPLKVLLTDGNSLSVQNVNKIIRKNGLNSDITASVLNWKDYGKMNDKYDFVLSADCLFFDEARSDLTDTIWHCLKEDGIAYVMAPKRGDTFEKFVQLVAKKGFTCLLNIFYDDVVWRKHLKLRESNVDYNEDIHYPFLLILTKSHRDFSY